jgi:hypothetical protein
LNAQYLHRGNVVDPDPVWSGTVHSDPESSYRIVIRQDI